MTERAKARIADGQVDSALDDLEIAADILETKTPRPLREHVLSSAE